MHSAKIGITGGTGLYEIDGLTDVEEVSVATPFGDPSGRVVTGYLDGVPMLFISRHGKGHMISPSEINYRANVYALKKLGVTHLVSISAVGSMKEGIAPGDFLVVDQFIDRTQGKRKSTFFTDGIVGHVAFADPVCHELSKDVAKAARTTGKKIHDRGTYLCIEGPQFSTRAESNLYRSWGVDVIGMTNIPECKLAREARMCYASLTLVTDYDCWKIGEEDVSVEAVLTILRQNVEGAKDFLKALPSALRGERECACGSALQNAIISSKEMIPEKLKRDLRPIVGQDL